MELSELKLALIQKITDCNDLETLMKIDEILNTVNQSILKVNEPTTIYERIEKVRVFNDWEQNKINKALTQYKNGECISDEDAQKEIQAWLED